MLARVSTRLIPPAHGELSYDPNCGACRFGKSIHRSFSAGAQDGSDGRRLTPRRVPSFQSPSPTSSVSRVASSSASASDSTACVLAYPLDPHELCDKRATYQVPPPNAYAVTFNDGWRVRLTTPVPGHVAPGPIPYSATGTGDGNNMLLSPTTNPRRARHSAPPERMTVPTPQQASAPKPPPKPKTSQDVSLKHSSAPIPVPVPKRNRDNLHPDDACTIPRPRDSLDLSRDAYERARAERSRLRHNPVPVAHSPISASVTILKAKKRVRFLLPPGT